MKIEQALFTLKIRRDLSPEEWADVAHALCRIAIDPYPPRSVAERRRVAVRAALSLFDGSKSARAKELEREYRRYLAGPWRLERDLESLPHPRSTEKVCLHRLARVNRGRSLGWRQLFDIAKTDLF